MTGTFLWSALIGLTLGSGVLVLVAGLPVMNRPRFTERVAPYVRSVAPDAESTVQSRAPITSAAKIFAPTAQRLAESLRRLGLAPSSEVLSKRLRHANLSLTPAEYRTQQLGYAVAGAAVGVLMTGLAFAAERFHPVAAVLFVTAGAGLGVAARDVQLNSRIRSRRRRMIAEFPTVAELLALSVSAGESAPGAFQRISVSCRGELAGELKELMRRTRAGTPFVSALRTLSAEIETPVIARFLHGVVVAVERGTPLAEVMRAQAADVRDHSKRELMEEAGRKEVAMLAPVVFGILPLTILFAAFPGLALLQIGI
ncbi:type II secretion system F family protein [Nesterenkonia salmonea]|uniref:Type II secretion system F family protein n=1 Tax=Nesterenkonia salmonea TaxID=1804987 RepID=A0A5R9B9P8_9MICC|nr:type II secretion system F family protein [Nesterenkonia salmonea]TLP96041.1 type II secretion system F family protein [Nesterenkonia salmonea]